MKKATVNIAGNDIKVVAASGLANAQKILEEINSEYKCDCSRERMERAIKALPAQEKMDIIVKEGKIEIKCSFCGRVEVWK